MKAKVNILGSCVSRGSMLNGNQSGHHIADENIEMGYFLDKQNIVCAMTPIPFTVEEIESVKAEELWDKSRARTVRQGIGKETVSLLMDSDADWLVFDLDDMQSDFAIYKECMISTCAHEFFNTALARKYRNEIQVSNFMKLPKWVWYGYVDLFFDKIMQKYDADHIIMNRFRSCTYYLAKDGRIKLVPDRFKQPYQANDAYNSCLAELEDYIIGKYHPYVIDLSKYFMGDENDWSNLQGAHFEKEFYRETFAQIRRIIHGETNQKYFSEPDFFQEHRPGLGEDMKRKFHVEQGLELLEKLLDGEDVLWLNILDKLNSYAPDDRRVRQYMQYLADAVGN